MRATTVTVELQAPSDEVFAFMSDVENLPVWATEFCQGIRVENGRHIASTPMGDMIVRQNVDRATGVIDSWYGPSEDTMSVAPIRVIERDANSSVLTFTFLPAPDMMEEVFQDQYTSLQREMKDLQERFSRE